MTNTERIERNTDMALAAVAAASIAGIVWIAITS
jgi:hypothetical protein